MAAFGEARKELKPDWVFCFDADEFPELDLTGTDFVNLSGIRLRLFDFYITPEDEHLSWEHRTWIGPEYRDILMFFKTDRVVIFPDREPALSPVKLVRQTGYVKHYGKSKSVAEWESTCNYYGNHLPDPYKSKWLSRKGKAVKHDYKSDFGNPLIKWDERIDKGFRLTREDHRRERRI